MKAKYYYLFILFFVIFQSCNNDDTTDLNGLYTDDTKGNLGSGNIDQDIRLMMTFAAVGDVLNDHKFNERKALEAYLKRTDLEINNNWELKWFGTNFIYSISAYVVQSKNNPDQYVVGFTGTKLLNLFEVTTILDLDEVVPFFEDNPNAKVSKGSKKIFKIAMKLKDGDKTMYDFIENIVDQNPDANFTFTGHSLGSAFSVYTTAFVFDQLKKEGKTVDIDIWGFGQPTFYNQAFVDEYLDLPFEKNFYSLENDIAHTKLFWNLDKLYDIPYPISENLKASLIDLGEGFSKNFPTGEDAYVAFPTIYVKNTFPIHKSVSHTILKNYIDYFQYAAYNHDRNHYLYSFGANCVPKDYNASSGNHCDD
ncbi:lipase family protein [Aureivirga sp. CE67]|uniref:lipase family protein n=1 Tax=Aureivirga sp. CE67 TaxID=1788983 RepID=UPI0018CA9E01|nr:hypothetical protein [Aureivirga sp. CE67]